MRLETADYYRYITDIRRDSVEFLSDIEERMMQAASAGYGYATYNTALAGYYLQTPPDEDKFAQSVLATVADLMEPRGFTVEFATVGYGEDVADDTSTLRVSW